MGRSKEVKQAMVPKALLMEFLAALDKANRLDANTSAWTSRRVGTHQERANAWRDVNKLRTDLVTYEEPIMSKKKQPKQDKSKKKVRLKDGDKDWDTKCEVCDSTPTVHPTGLCGPCCWGDSSTVGGNW